MSEQIAIVILAAGQGKRMKSDLPKVLTRTRERTLIAHVLSTAQSLAPERCIVVTGFKRELVEGEVSCLMPNASFALQQSPQGTGDAAKAALPQLFGFSGTVLILYGDAPLITSETLQALLAVHTKERATVTILSFLTPDPKAYGRLVRDPKTGRVTKIVETKDCSPEERLIRECNSGIYAVDSSFLAPALNALTNKNAQGEYYLTDIVEKAAKEGQTIATYIAPDFQETEGVNNLADLAFVNTVLLSRQRQRYMTQGVTLEDPATFYPDPEVQIGQGTSIGPSVILKGKTVIGDQVAIEGMAHLTNVRIADRAKIKFSVRAEDASIGEGAQVGPFAHLRPGSVLESEVHLGNFVETKKAHLKRGAKANHLTYLGDCSVGERTNVGAGTITCNYDGFKKSTTTIGNNVFIGSDTCLIAPITIGDGATIGAGSVLSKEVEPDALAFTRSELVTKSGWSIQKRKRSSSPQK